MKPISLVVGLLAIAALVGALFFSSAKPDPVAIILATNQSDSVDGLNGVDPVGPALIAEGYKVYSLDLPCHFKGMENNGLDCWSERISAGEQSLLLDFCSEVSALIDTIGAARVQFVGVSRGGFVAYQCAALDDRVTEIAQVAPVTDLSRLREFEGTSLDPALFDLDQYAERLARKGVLIRIGNRDDRVGTDAAVHLGEMIGAEIELLDIDGHRAPDPDNVMAKWLRQKWDALT